MYRNTSLALISFIAALSFAPISPARASYVIPDGSVTTAKLAANAVTTAKIANNAVGQAQRAALVQQISASSGSSTTSSSTYVAVANLSVTITTTGRPVLLMLMPDGTDQASNGSGVIGSTTYNAYGEWEFVRDGAGIGFVTIPNGSSSDLAAAPCASFQMIDMPTAASHTYTVDMRSFTATNVGVYYCKLAAYEL